ncbi:MAG: HD domain-containing protein [Bacillus sp. (in: Bacteria)]|nr:HD domain-containing protein [Bacillus sp. (in: firmicutes)]MCM1426079.1 HD domain-containing protein [Eubacterium sp.]
MFPDREEAKRLLIEAQSHNPGAWVNHSETVAYCAEKIAEACSDLDAEKAYVLGLLHDIGRRFGIKHFGHIYDGYVYMTQLGYDEVARICISHSFSIQKIEDYIGKFDVTDEQQQVVENYLHQMVYDDYDKLIQLCDSIGAADGIVSMEERMNDVKRRYGSYPQDKWDKNLALREYFSKKAGKDVYLLF